MFDASETYNDLILLGEYIKHLREKKGISAYKLSLRSGVYASVVSRLERGAHNPTWGTLNKIIGGFDMSVAQFFKGYIKEWDRKNRVGE